MTTDGNKGAAATAVKSENTKTDLGTSDPKGSRESFLLERAELDPFAPLNASDTENENIFESVSLPISSRVKQIWAIGGGKGGVGKSLIASSLAISLTRMNQEVVAIDLDLGGANLHTALGVDLPRQTLSDFFSGRVSELNQCMVSTGIPHLNLISGAQDSVGIANITTRDKVRLLQKIRELDADYVILDLGAGTSFSTIDFFLYADIGLLSVLPEPTSIENAYRFIKSAYYRRLWHSRHLRDIRNLIEMAMDSKNTLNIKSPSDLYREVNQSKPEAALRLKQEIEKFKPKLIINQARTQTDVDIGFSIKTVCKKYFGIEMDFVGYLDYDSSVWQAVRRKKPLMVEFPNSRLVSSLERITQFVVKRYANSKYTPI